MNWILNWLFSTVPSNRIIHYVINVVLSIYLLPRIIFDTTLDPMNLFICFISIDIAAYILYKFERTGGFK